MTTLPQDELISTPMPGPRARALAERARDAVPRAMSAAMPTFAAATDRGILEDVRELAAAGYGTRRGHVDHAVIGVVHAAHDARGELPARPVRNPLGPTRRASLLIARRSVIDV